MQPLKIHPIKNHLYTQCLLKFTSFFQSNKEFHLYSSRLVDFMHHLPTGQVNVFPANYVTLLRKAFRLACNGSNLSKGRAGKSIFFAPCLLLSKQERETAKKENLNSNLASQKTHLEFGVI